jgi:hypothetical protein
MGDLLESLIQGSQKRTILCVIGVGCYIISVTKDINVTTYL